MGADYIADENGEFKLCIDLSQSQTAKVSVNRDEVTIEMKVLPNQGICLDIGVVKGYKR